MKARALSTAGGLAAGGMYEIPASTTADASWCMLAKTAAAKALMKALPPPKHVPTVSEDSDDVEVCVLKNIDPVSSYKEHLDAMPEEEEDDGPGGDGQRVQCAQQ